MSNTIKQEEQAVLRGAKDKLVARKMEVTKKIAEFKAVMGKKFMPDFKFKLMSDERGKKVAELMELDAEIRKINIRLRLLEEDLPLNGDMRRGFISELREIRDKYQDIAAGEYDAHGPSERLLASQFVRDLNPILRKLINE